MRLGTLGVEGSGRNENRLFVVVRDVSWRWRAHGGINREGLLKVLKGDMPGSRSRAARQLRAIISLGYLIMISELWLVIFPTYSPLWLSRIGAVVELVLSRLRLADRQLLRPLRVAHEHEWDEKKKKEALFKIRGIPSERRICLLLKRVIYRTWPISFSPRPRFLQRKDATAARRSRSAFVVAVLRSCFVLFPRFFVFRIFFYYLLYSPFPYGELRYLGILQNARQVCTRTRCTVVVVVEV